jgi:3-methyl-2-oxobutanoate hydroxymethyltransferase
MNAGGPSHTAPPSPDRAPVSVPRLAEMKAAGQPIVMVTAYDYPSAKVAEEAGVDIVLVGDTAAMVVLGYPGTEPVSMDEMIMLGKAVRRGLRTPLMVGDMPMGSYESGNELAVQSAQRLVKETGCQVVKLEAGGTSVERARAIVRSGIPVMGHVGLTPQTATALGGYKTQGKTAKAAIKLCEDALALQSVGCFAIVFEAVPAAVTEAIVEKLEIPTIGIGAGPATAGQVLVYHDLLGITTGRTAKFVKRYAEVHDVMVDGVRRYTEEVRSRHFPEPDHVYGVEPAELDALRRYLDQESLTSQKAWDWEPLP